jgi:hypothetical protein
MFHTYKKNPEDVPNASPGLLRWFAGTDNKPKAKDENGNLIDFVGPQGEAGLQGPQGDAGASATFTVLTQAAYDELDPPVEGVLYLIEETP